MTDRSPWLLALATANFIVLAALAILARSRFQAIEARIAAKEESRPAEARPTEPPGKPRAAGPRRADGDADAGSREERGEIVKRLQELSNNLYDNYSELSNDHHQMKQTLKQVAAAVRKIQHSLAAPGTPSGEWLLGPRATAETALSPETTESYRRDAASWGVAIEPGRVTVRGFLNMSPWTTMPIEYFVTRFPESGHETLLHVLGPVTVESAASSGDRLKGLVTAIYKALVVAGFKEGQSGQLAAPAAGDKSGEPRWIPPTGDDVYVGVRYSIGGNVHIARATDWVVDPDTASVLPEKAFKFTGSLRQDDYDSGDEQISSEAGGIVVSVYGNPNSLVEIAVPDNVSNRYQYNHARIPKIARIELGKGGAVLEGTRDRAKSSLTLKTIERDGKRGPIEKAPTLVGRASNGDPVEATFEKTDGGWTIVSDALSKGEWHLRVEVDGQPVDSTGFDAAYVDLIFSKTPIVPEGDGALPVEKPELPTNLPTGTGRKEK